MPGTYTDLLYHIFWSTKGRERWITPDVIERLHAFMGGIVRDLGGTALIIGGVEDHVHILARCRPDLSISDFMRELKARSSRWVHETFEGKKGFAWQEGYTAVTVSPSVKPKVHEYIARQAEHHRTKSFREELIEFLERHGIEYDPRYLD